MTYTKPEVTVLGDAACLIEGQGPGHEPNSTATPGPNTMDDIES